MFPGEKNLHRSFASASPVFVALGLALCVAPISAARAHAESSGTATTVKRQAATTQFARAEEQREQLNSKPSESARSPITSKSFPVIAGRLITRALPSA